MGVVVRIGTAKATRKQMPEPKNIQDRAELLATIAELCEKYPDWRLGQLVANAAGWADQDIWNIDDEQLLEAARRHLQQFTRSPATPAR